MKILLVFLLLLSHVASGQRAKSADYLRPYYRIPMGPKDIMRDGEVKIFGIILEYKKNKLVDSIQFSKNSSPDFKEWIDKCRKRFQDFPWTDFIPEVENKTDFKIWWTFYFVPDDSTASKHILLPSVAMEKMLLSSYDLLPGNQDQIYVAPPFFVICYPTRYKYVGGCSYTPPDSVKVK
ncbi:hypothetical protein SAMN05444266_10997 [Chitinophaga jiangningensis]|uniref:TonB protein C-terminal n=1 Tax=Chitinophaga jiangningensis TaxID=1419482 RepID=A0A1M7K0B8_9BACT|nr:hypothetical protein [Chitinophaga jiangningensis]SHM58760.1 hypothetical protein SAMN05444266_10997 [Chitinophaga jiangningensis]